MQAKNIDEVLAALTEIVHNSLIEKTRIGYFAALYLRVTWSVKRAITAGDVFQDNARMEQLDVTFANRFLEAWTLHNNGGKPTKPWRIAFDALSGDDYMVLQHMAVGMNAHINLDLGIAAEETMRSLGQPLEDLHTDFNMINTILDRLIGIVQVQLSELSHTFRNIEHLAPGLQNKLMQDIMLGIRDGAWNFAVKLDGAKHDLQRNLFIEERELWVDPLGKVILHPVIFPEVRHKIVEEEAANGIGFNVQVIAE